MLATNALDTTPCPPQELLAGETGQALAERGFRFLKALRFLASSCVLKKIERIMAPPFLTQKGNRCRTQRQGGSFQDVVGIHVLLIPGEEPLGLNLAAAYQRLLRRRGKPYTELNGIHYS
jgi:hypothetical protein